MQNKTLISKVATVNNRTMKAPTDAELVIAFQRGNTSALDTLFKRSKKFIDQTMNTVGVDHSEAEDIKQMVYIKVWKGLKSLRQPATFRHWLARIIRNAWISHLRKAIPERAAIGFSLDEPISDSNDSPTNRHELVADHNRQPASELDYKDLERLLYLAISCIPAAFRDSLRYRISDYTYEDIALITNKVTGTVKSRINRGRDSLLKILLSDLDRYEPVIEKMKDFGLYNLDDIQPNKLNGRLTRIVRVAGRELQEKASGAGPQTQVTRNESDLNQQRAANSTKDAGSCTRRTRDG